MPKRQKGGKREYLEEERNRKREGGTKKQNKVRGEKKIRACKNGGIFQSGNFLVCVKHPLNIATFFGMLIG